MDCKSKPFTQINREYKVTSKELKEKLGIEGEITNMGLLVGRSPAQREEGKSAERDLWYIETEEIEKLAKKCHVVYMP